MFEILQKNPPIYLVHKEKRSTFALAFKKESGRTESRGDRQQKEIFEGI